MRLAKNLRNSFSIFKFYLLQCCFSELAMQFNSLINILKNYHFLSKLSKLTIIPLQKGSITLEFIFRYIVLQLRYHKSLTLVLKLLLKEFLRLGSNLTKHVKGIKFSCYGRFTRRERGMKH